MNSIRVIGGTTPQPASELVPLDEAAERLGIHTDTLRRWIKADMADGRNRVPGSRGEGSKYVILRAVFDRALRDGVEPPRTPEIVSPDLTEIVQHLRRRATEDLALADDIAALIADTRRAS